MFAALIVTHANLNNKTCKLIFKYRWYWEKYELEELISIISHFCYENVSIYVSFSYNTAPFKEINSILFLEDISQHLSMGEIFSKP